MRISLRWILACFFLLSFCPSAYSQVYKWRDKDGNLIVSTTPPPPGVQSEKRETDQSRQSYPDAKNADRSKDTVQEVELGRANGDISVIMYVTDWCPVCKKARTYLNSLGVDLTEYDVEKDPEKLKEYLDKGNNETGVPLIDIEGIMLRGFSKNGILAALDKRRRTGYLY
jgi:glutaredoxin